eukprot:GHVU01178409.1.p1 GENE.GHVU01178409.1~~GHVU01178409.1.p1  ORF type:complete len:128 (-),score=10.00 GHVU01178409.1:195-578(-)
MLIFIHTQQSPTMLSSLFLRCLIFRVYSLFTAEALTRASSSSSFVIVVMLAGSIATLRISASGDLLPIRRLMSSSTRRLSAALNGANNHRCICWLCRGLAAALARPHSSPRLPPKEAPPSCVNAPAP